MARSNGGVGPIVSDAGRPVVPELCMEREGTSLNVEQLTVLLDGGETFTEKRRAIGQLFASCTCSWLLLITVEKRVLENPIFDQDNRYNLTNDENYIRGTEKFIESVKLNLCDLFEKLYLMRYAKNKQLMIKNCLCMCSTELSMKRVVLWCRTTLENW